MAARRRARRSATAPQPPWGLIGGALAVAAGGVAFLALSPPAQGAATTPPTGPAPVPVPHPAPAPGTGGGAPAPGTGVPDHEGYDAAGVHGEFDRNGRLVSGTVIAADGVTGLTDDAIGPVVTSAPLATGGGYESGTPSATTFPGCGLRLLHDAWVYALPEDVAGFFSSGTGITLPAGSDVVLWQKKNVSGIGTLGFTVSVYKFATATGATGWIPIPDADLAGCPGAAVAPG